MPSQARPIPEGYHTVTPYLTVSDCAQAISFYQKAFGAKQVVRMDSPDGKVMHAELKIGDSMIMLADENPRAETRSPKSLRGTTAGIFLYVENVDASFNQAVSAGAKAEMPPSDMFWGDRYGKLTDPFGHSWSLATHKEDVSPEEMRKRTQEMMAKAGQEVHA